VSVGLHAIAWRRSPLHAWLVPLARRREGLLAELGYAIRTPMNAILGMTDLVLDGPLDHDQRTALESVRASAASLLGLLSNLLDYARLRTGPFDLDAAPFDVRDTVYAAIRAVAPGAHAKGLEVVWQV